MSTTWPSPLPGPAWAAWRTGWDHIETKTLAEVSVDTYALLRQVPAVMQAADRAAQMAQSGDVLATRAAMNAWVRALKAARQALTEVGV
jgi:hypothetical protein